MSPSVRQDAWQNEPNHQAFASAPMSNPVPHLAVLEKWQEHFMALSQRDLSNVIGKL